MPSSPMGLCRDCSRRAVANGYCADHQTNNSKRTHKLLYDRYRAADDPIRSLYRNRRWQATRRIVLQRDILCRSCGHKAATDCDHVLSARLVHDNYGLDAFYEPERCQGLCHKCHSSKTAMECGWTGNKGTKLTDLGDRSNLTVVCGQAGSGKTTYVAQHKAEHDLVWDYDVVMSDLTGLPMHEGLADAVGSVLANRDAWLQGTQHCPNHCWMIVTNPQTVIVTMCRDAGARIIIMDTPDDICQQRLRERFIAANTQQTGS